MRTWLHRVRGTIGMGLTWAAACSVAGAVPRWVFGLQTDVPIPIVAAVFGFLAGVTFSGILVLMEGRRRLDQISLLRFAVWGAMGGLLASMLFAEITSLGLSVVPAIAPVFALASAVCASGTLALARRTGKAASTIDAGTHAAELPEQESRRLQ